MFTSGLIGHAHCRLITLVLALRHLIENHSIMFPKSNPFYANRSTYFIGHIVLLVAIVFVRGGQLKPSHETKATEGEMTSQQAKGSVKVENHKDISVTHVANNNALYRLNRNA